jgi:hypothetical protein
MTVACQAFYGSNSGNRLTVDPDNNVSFSVVVNGQNGGDGSQAFVWGCELTALGGPNCPSGFAGSGDLSGLTVSFADPGEGKAADYKITVAAIAADGTSKSDYCTITVDNNSGQQVVGAGKWQCHDANLACYNDQTSCAQGCSGQCVECVLNGSCSQGQDCNADATVQTDDPSQFLNGLGGHKPPTYPVVPDNSKLLVNGVGGGGLNLGVLKPPNFSDFMGLLQAVFKYLLFFAIPLAVLVFAAASVVMLTSRGEPNKLSTAKKMFVWGAVGLAIILLAQGILSAVMSLLTGGH